MHINTFDHYLHGHSPVHRLDARVKVVVALLFIVSNVLLPDGAWLAFALGWLFLMGLSRLAGVPSSFLLKRGFIVLPFALAAITVVFTLPGQPLLVLRVGSTDIVVSDAGLIRFVSIMIRSWLSVLMAILLTTTTQFPDVMHALRHLRVPAVIIAIVSFMYRYLFVLADEALRLLRAREARSAQGPAGTGGGSLRWRARVAGNMVGQLFLRSFERSDRVYNAMLARGYAGQLLTLNPHAMRRQDWLHGALALLAIVALQVVGRVVG